jgi:2-polyprenyl-6-methoxyphenol hydroxylase-like FAD-dependent oxidoreductase
MREEQTEVLVVGAGPVGLLTALLLNEAGIEAKIIDREARTTARSYACALHPRTLKLLERMGLAAAVLDRGRRIQTIAFYDGESRRAEIRLSELGGDFPFLLILPQNAFEDLLEQRLRKAGAAVTWNHRFDDLKDEAETVVATVEEMGGTATGYIVPHWETVVKRRFPVRARYLVGADGPGSLVRQRLGIEHTRVAGPEFFAAYEFESEARGEDEVRVVLDEATTNVLWPLPENKYRWTFQMVKSEVPIEFPEKERRAVHFTQKTVDEKIRQYVEKVTKQRAPWFTASVKEITWCTDVVFEHRMAKQFGRGRCWLAGDAAHQTGPVGVQSMNVGLSEAAALADNLRKLLREHAPQSLLQTYNRERQDEWRRMLGLTGGLKTRSDTSVWAGERRARILPCLPGSEEDLTGLASQLGFGF